MAAFTNPRMLVTKEQEPKGLMYESRRIATRSSKDVKFKGEREEHQTSANTASWTDPHFGQTHVATRCVMR
jgi:hypothetical protein